MTEITEQKIDREECDQKKMEYMRICFCKSCKALDYAIDQCPRCKSTDITEASIDFLLFENMAGIGRKICNISYDSSILIEK